MEVLLFFHLPEDVAGQLMLRVARTNEIKMILLGNRVSVVITKVFIRSLESLQSGPRHDNFAHKCGGHSASRLGMV